MAATASLTGSHLQELLAAATVASRSPPQPAHLLELATTVLYNLQHQQDWSDLFIHTMSPVTGEPLARPMVSGLPPRRAYVHPDEQAEILKTEHETGEVIQQAPEQEWILPTHLAENWSLRQFAEVFDSISIMPPSDADIQEDDISPEVGSKWRGHNRQKRVLLATLHDDSTIVYYIVHDGIVKPRQN